MDLSLAQLEEIFELLEANETVLQQMGEAEEKERQQRLAAAYDIILDYDRRGREEKEASEIGGSDDSSDNIVDTR